MLLGIKPTFYFPSTFRVCVFIVRWKIFTLFFINIPKLEVQGRHTAQIAYAAKSAVCAICIDALRMLSSDFRHGWYSREIALSSSQLYFKYEKKVLKRNV